MRNRAWTFQHGGVFGPCRVLYGQFAAAAMGWEHTHQVGEVEMQGYNLIAVYNQAADKLLMCKRKRDPYQGLSNLVGGKIEVGEDGLDAAYRELEEETSITKADIVLTHLMDFTYYLDSCFVEVYVGRLNKQICVHGDENDLYWSELDDDFYSMKAYAGEGNIGHILEHIKMNKEKLLV